MCEPANTSRHADPALGGGRRLRLALDGAFLRHAGRAGSRARLHAGIISLTPMALVRLNPGRRSTRHVIAVGRMLASSLLIHLTGGRIETHFLIFGSLAFLSFYLDWAVLLTASLVVAVDHVLRGLYFPASIFGIDNLEPWRWMEHAGWVVFCDIFLIASGDRALCEIARRLASCMPPGALLARIGGDEFVALLPEQCASAEIDALAQELLTCLLTPVRLGEQSLRIGAHRREPLPRPRTHPRGAARESRRGYVRREGARPARFRRLFGMHAEEPAN